MAAFGGRVHLGGPLAEGDTPWAWRFAALTLDRAREAWEAQGTARFLASGFWETAARTGALNVLDFALLLWPARALLPRGADLAAVALVVLVAAALAGILFAGALGAGPYGQAAAGLVVGASGLVLHHLDVGQYPQALVVAPLLAFAGFVRLWRGERGGVALAGGAAAASGLLYWQFGVVLGLGAVSWAVAALGVGQRPSAGFARRLGAAGALCGAVLVLPAVPVLQELRSGKAAMDAVAWGTPFPGLAGRRDPTLHIVDELRWGRLLDPGGGWLPALPLAIALGTGLAGGRRALPWVALGLVGLALAIGPWPDVPDALGGVAVDGAPGGLRRYNVLYGMVYRWIPTAPRMHHPLRWGLLLLAATAALVAAGADRLGERRPRVALGVLIAGAAWAVLVGPWPQRATPFPGEAARAVAGCAELWTPDGVGPGAECRWAVADGILGVPRYPVAWCRMRNQPPPLQADMGRNGPRVDAMRRVLAGDARARTDGACVAVRGDADARVLERLAATLGPPERYAVPPATLFSDGEPHTLLLFPAP